MSSVVRSLQHPTANQWIGWVVLLLTLPLIALITGVVLNSSIPTVRPIGGVMLVDPRTGQQTTQPAPINYRCELGQIAESVVFVLPILQCGYALLATFGPFTAVRDTLGRKLMALVAFNSLPHTVVCCLWAKWAINYIDL